MAQLAAVITLFVFVALSRGTLSILSPIMEAQAQERKRRESADHPSTTTTTTSTTTLPIAPKPLSSPTPPLPEKKENTTLNDIPTISSPSVDEEEEERRRIRQVATISAAEDHHRRSFSEGGEGAPLMRSWSDMGVSSAESFSPTTEESRDELSDLLQRRKPSCNDAVVPQHDDDLDTR